MSYKYKAKSGLDFFIPGVGQSINGILETETEILECPVIELIIEEQPLVQATPVAQPGAVIGVAPQATVATPEPTITNGQEL